jgi:hypothetical protein
MATGIFMWGDELSLLGITGALGIISGLSFWGIARPDSGYVTPSLNHPGAA